MLPVELTMTNFARDKMHSDHWYSPPFYTHPHGYKMCLRVDANGCINPLTTEFFPPRQHIFMHSAHTTFVGTPLPQHSLLSGQTWWGPHTWRDPSGNTVNDIHDPPQGQKSEVKGGCQPDFRPAFPETWARSD